MKKRYLILMNLVLFVFACNNGKNKEKIESPYDLTHEAYQMLEESKEIAISIVSTSDEPLDDLTELGGQAPNSESTSSLSLLEIRSYLLFDMTKYGADWDLQHNVKMLSDQELKNHEVSIDKDGKMYQNGKLMADKEYMFIMKKNGDLYAGEKIVGHFHHSSLARQGPVASAGHIEVKDGKLLGFNNWTGHYRMPSYANRQLLSELIKRKVTLSSIIVGDVSVNSKLNESTKPGDFLNPLKIENHIDLDRPISQMIDDVYHKKSQFESSKSWPDGTEQISYKDGRIATVWPEGTIRTVDLSGTIRTMFTNGITEEVLASGVRKTINGNTGVTIIDSPNAPIKMVYTNGMILSSGIDGEKIIEFPDGSSRIIATNGTVDEIDSKGVSRRHLDTGVLYTYQNGVLEIKYNNATSEKILLDGTQIKKYDEVYEGKAVVGEQRNIDVQEKVTYLASEADRLKYEVFVTKEGHVIDFLGNKVSVDQDKGIFVMDKNGRIFLGEYEQGKFHHSSFLAGQPASASGKIQVENGVIKYIDNFSPQYRDVSSTDRLIKELSGRNLDTQTVKVGFVTDFERSIVNTRDQKIGFKYDDQGALIRDLKPASFVDLDFDSIKKTSFRHNSIQNIFKKGSIDGVKINKCRGKRNNPAAFLTCLV